MLVRIKRDGHEYLCEPEQVLETDVLLDQPPGAGVQGPPAEEVAAKAAELAAMTTAQLQELCKAAGLTPPEGAVKRDLIVILTAAAFTPAEEPEEDDPSDDAQA